MKPANKLNPAGLRIVLVLQGGGALGAYQAGVYQALHEHEAARRRQVSAGIVLLHVPAASNRKLIQILSICRCTTFNQAARISLGPNFAGEYTQLLSWHSKGNSNATNCRNHDARCNDHFA